MWSRLTELAEKGLAEVAASADGAPQEDELWARFTAIVAPPGDERRELSGAEREQERELELETAKAEEDEQEQYICELERALLQRKRANEALEAKVRDLEAAQDAQTEAQLKRQLQAAVRSHLGVVNADGKGSFIYRVGGGRRWNLRGKRRSTRDSC